MLLIVVHRHLRTPYAGRNLCKNAICNGQTMSVYAVFYATSPLERCVRLIVS